MLPLGLLSVLLVVEAKTVVTPKTIRYGLLLGLAVLTGHEGL